ncbi:MAG: hypothetical protein JSV92_03830, partial [archaeon]
MKPLEEVQKIVEEFRKNDYQEGMGPIALNILNKRISEELGDEFGDYRISWFSGTLDGKGNTIVLMPCHITEES